MTDVYLAVVTWGWLIVGTSDVKETVAVLPENAAVETPAFDRCVDASFPLVSWSVDFEPVLSSLRSFAKMEVPGVVGTYFAAVVVAAAAAAAAVVDFAAAVVEEVLSTVVVD